MAAEQKISWKFYEDAKYIESFLEKKNIQKLSSNIVQVLSNKTLEYLYVLYRLKYAIFVDMPMNSYMSFAANFEHFVKAIKARTPECHFIYIGNKFGIALINMIKFDITAEGQFKQHLENLVADPTFVNENLSIMQEMNKYL
jgi:hypothetical protein